MALASGVRVGLRYVAEVTRGTTPVTPAMKVLRATARNPNLQRGLLTSEEVRADRQIADLRHGFNQVVGEIGYELSIAAYNDMIEFATGGTWGDSPDPPEFAGSVKQIKVAADALKTMTLERAFLDVTKFQVFRGVAINTWAVNIAPEAMIGGTFGLTGMSAAALSGTPLDASPDAAPTGSPMAAFDAEITYDGGVIGVVTACNFTLNNNRTLQPVVGSKFSPDVFEGQAIITGELTALMDATAAFFVDFEEEAEIALKIKCEDPAGDFIGFSFPRIKLTAAPITPPQTGPITIQGQFQALYDGTAGTSLIIERSDADA